MVIQTLGVIYRRLYYAATHFSSILTSLSGFLASLVLVIAVGGCASSNPSALLVEHPVVTASPHFNPQVGLRVVTYNIWGLPSWMSGARRGRYPRIARELERLDPDFILLQEAWTARARKAVPMSGRWAVAYAAGQHSFFQQCGLVTLSKYPIIGGQFYPFSHTAFPDRFVNKGVLKIKVELADGRVLNIWNVHLQDGGSPRVRLAQVRELIWRIKTAEDGQIADLVGGDFNCTPGSLEYSQLENALGPSLQQLSGAAHFLTWDGLSTKPGAGETLDYIFVRGQSVSPSVSAPPRMVFTAPTLQQRLSDHLGIEALVNLGPWPRLAVGSEPLAQVHDGNHFEPFTNPERVYVGRGSAMFGEKAK